MAVQRRWVLESPSAHLKTLRGCQCLQIAILFKQIAILFKQIKIVKKKSPLHTIELQAHFAFLGESDTPRRSRTTFRILFRRDFTVFGEIFSTAADPASVSPAPTTQRLLHKWSPSPQLSPGLHRHVHPGDTAAHAHLLPVQQRRHNVRQQLP